jgi:hypothetical protein
MLAQYLARDILIEAELPVRSGCAYGNDAIQACGVIVSRVDWPPAMAAIDVSY